jgi:hypothetical protein
MDNGSNMSNTINTPNIHNTGACKKFDFSKWLSSKHGCSLIHQLSRLTVTAICHLTKESCSIHGNCKREAAFV